MLHLGCDTRASLVFHVHTGSDEHTGSAVVVCGLRCPMKHGILVPQPGIKPTSSALEGGFLTTGPPGKTPTEFIKYLLDNMLDGRIHKNI